jgi:hypothetical protein
MLALRALQPGDMPAYRSLRLIALTDHPDVFGESAASFAQTTVTDLQKSLETRMAAGGFSLGAFS